MAQPPAYSIATDFSDYQASNPGEPMNGAQLDAEFVAIQATIAAIRARLAELQADDTTLNRVVDPDSLTTATRALITTGWTYQGAWVAATAYAIGDVVTNGGVTYVCAEAHTAGTFATDLAASKWVVISTGSVASGISYDNATSGMTADDVQAALDELGTAAIQAIAALTPAADKLPYFTGGTSAALADLTAAGRALLDDADAAAQRVTLGLAALALKSTINNDDWSGTALAVSNGGTGASSAPAARGSLGLEIGADVQAYDANLDALAGVSSNGVLVRTGAGAAAARSVTGGSGITVTNGDGVSGNIEVALTGGNAADQTARDMAATAIALADAAGTPGTKGPLVLSDPFTSDTLATSTNATYDAANDRYYNYAVPTTDYSNTGGEGDRTSATGDGSVAASTNHTPDSGTADNLIDGSTGTSSGVSIDLDQTEQCDGVYFRFDFDAGSGAKKYIDEVKLSFSGGQAASGLGGGTFKVQGSDDASSWDDLATFNGNQSASAYTVALSSVPNAGYRYYQIIGTTSDVFNNVWFAEVEFKIADGDPFGDMTLRPSAGALDTADPSDVDLYFVAEFPDDDVTLNTDIVSKFSIDNGATWATGAIEKVGDFDTGAVYRAAHDVSAQTGALPIWEITTANNKRVALYHVIGALPIY